MLKFLGCGAAFHPMLGNTSAFFEQNGDLFLIDCGESVFLKLYKLGMLTKYRDYYIAVTHLHADHVGSLGSMISYMYYVLHKKVHVIHPSPRLIDLLDLMGIARDAYEMHLCDEFSSGDVSLRAVPTKHADDMYCCGYLISDGCRRIYYSGDSYEIAPDILRDFLDGKIDALCQDTTDQVSAHRSHYPLPELAEVIPPERRNKVYCMHLNCDFDEKIAQYGFKSARTLLVSEK